jgi:hypothetical protein
MKITRCRFSGEWIMIIAVNFYVIAVSLLQAICLK